MNSLLRQRGGVRGRIGTNSQFWGVDNGTDGRFGALDKGTDGGFGGLDNGTDRRFRDLDNGTDGEIGAYSYSCANRR